MPYLDGLPIAASVSATDIIAVDQGGTPGLAGTATTRQTTLADILQLGPGPITGPGSSVNGDIVTFNGTTGRLLADGGVTLAAIAPSTAMRPVVQAASLAAALQALSTPVDAMFGVPAFGVSASTQNQNGIIGQVVNTLPPNSNSAPTGVTGYGKVMTTGNQAFGLFGRADLGALGVTGRAVNEVNSFNYAGVPSGAVPPVGVDYVTIGLQSVAFGDFPSIIGLGVMYADIINHGQAFQYGIYTQPGATLNYSLVLDATGTVGPVNAGALIRSTGVEPNLILQTMSSPTLTNTVMAVIDHTGIQTAIINQNGDYQNAGFSLSGTGVLKFLNGLVTTTATAGSASALPAVPLGYVKVEMNGTDVKIPFYNL